MVGAFLILLLSGSVILASDDVNLRRSIDVFQVQSFSSYSGDCGMANENGKLYGGNETEPNEYPWQALLLVFIEYRSASGKKVVAPSEFCGGTLIDDRWILTSANCLALQTG
jgi:secreted trypsin-like serine protease